MKQFVGPFLNQNIQTCASKFIQDHEWASVLCQVLNNHAEIPYGWFNQLEDKKKLFFYMVVTRLESFRNKYCLENNQEFTNEQLIYAISMMLKSNKKEHELAMNDAQSLLKDVPSQPQY